MAETTLIELRQLEGQNLIRNADGSVQNGVWTNVLDTSNQVILENGDQVQVKSVFLDTSAAASGFIEVTADTDVTMTAAMYLQNYNKDQGYAWVQTPPDPLPVGWNYLRLYPNGFRPVENDELGGRGDNNPWFLSQVNTSSAETWKIDNISLDLVHPNSDTRDYGGLDVVFLYTKTSDPTNKFGYSWPLKLHPKRRTNQYSKYAPYPCDLLVAGDATNPDFKLAPNSGNQLYKHGILSVSFTKTAFAAATPIITLQEFPVKFTVPAGSYTPIEMADVINGHLNNIQSTGKVNDDYSNVVGKTNWPVMSQLLTTILKNEEDIKKVNAGAAQIFVNASGYEKSFTNADATPTDRNGEYYFKYDIPKMIAEGDGASGTYTRPPLDAYCGTNQIACIFDEVAQKIKFDIQHFPIYTGATTDAGLSANDALPSALYNSTESIQNIFVTGGLATRYSGICWTSLQPSVFWNEMLGFTDITVAPSYTSKMNYPLSTDVITVENSFKMPVKDGVNITGAFPGLDLGVVHDDTLYGTPVYSAPGGVPANVAQRTNDVSSIFSSRTFNSSLADEGYFLLDIKSNIQQKLVSSSLTTSHTQSIINRYYTANSFTSDTGNGSILYTHSGEPQLLSDFQITIRNPDRSLVDSHILQNKNTVFLEVVKPIKRLEAKPVVSRTA